MIMKDFTTYRSTSYRNKSDLTPEIVKKKVTINSFVKKKKKRPPRASRCLYLALSLAVCHRRCISVRTHSHSRIVNRRQLQIFSMPNFCGCRRRIAIPSDRAFDNSHCVIVTRVNEHRFASDVGHLSAIYQNLSASEKSG